MASSSVIVKATAPFRSFLNQRFADLHERMENLEHRVDSAMETISRQTQETIELQKALLDSMILLGAAVTDAKVAEAKVAELQAVQQKASTPAVRAAATAKATSATRTAARSAAAARQGLTD